jgi:hypothetical protein
MVDDGAGGQGSRIMPSHADCARRPGPASGRKNPVGRMQVAAFRGD